jgi:asparagine synthase (glutamine-hydrolysing)
LETKKSNLDGVGYGWIDKLKEVVAVEVTDEQLAMQNPFPLQTPTSKKNIITVLSMSISK